MSQKTDSDSQFEVLKKRAEARLKTLGAGLPSVPTSDTEILQILYELQIHQIELELQNEELEESRAELDALLRKYTDLYDFAPIGYLTLTSDGIIQEINLSGLQLLENARDALLGQNFRHFISPLMHKKVDKFIESVFATQERKTCVVNLWQRGEALTWVRIDGIKNELARAGKPVGNFALQDVTEQIRNEARIRENEARFRAITKSAYEAIIVLEGSGIICEWNPGAERLFGYSESESVGASINMIISLKKIFYQDTNDPEGRSRLHEHLLSGTHELEGVDKVGRVFPIEISFSEWKALGKHYCALILRDISERKRTESELIYKSTHDSLTGLYNRRYFDAEIARIQLGRQAPVTIVMADLDGLKIINDTHGHQAGDALLERVGQVLQTAFRSEDIVARMGGDEFAVILVGVNENRAKEALQRVRMLIKVDNELHPEIPLRLSLGVSTASHPMHLTQTLREADEAMYSDKRRVI